MKNQKLLTIATLAGLTLGGLSVSAASAQSYGESRNVRGCCVLSNTGSRVVSVAETKRAIEPAKR